jgi:putative (di)nucleoside polyphosphate hydrolase
MMVGAGSLHTAHIGQTTPVTYRPNVGIALFDRAGRVFVARRIKDDGPEIVLPGLEWQMPQGGVDPDEDLEAAARRELWEETGVTSVAVLGTLSSPVRYDFPPYDGPPHRLAVFRGQEQRWFAMRFLGEDSEIDLAIGGNGADPEFDLWRWERLERVPDLVVPFRRAIYAQVAREFSRFARP